MDYSFYKEHMDRAAVDLYEGMAVNRAIEQVRFIWWGDDQEAKKQYGDVLFLADPNFPDPEGWVKKAVLEFDTKDVFAPAREGGVEFSVLGKCRFVKAYRTIVKEKRKQKLEPTATIKEIIERCKAAQEGENG